MTRQTQNSFLRANYLWQELEQSELELVSAADGQWSDAQIEHVTEWCEQLRLLRWVLGVDAQPTPLAHFPRIDFSLALELLQEKASLARKRTVQPSDLRVQRDIARQYTARVVAELKVRGLIASGPELEGWADEFRAECLGASSDYLAGAKTIADLDNGALRLLGTFSVARQKYASYLIEQLNAVHPFAFSTWTGFS